MTHVICIMYEGRKNAALLQSTQIIQCSCFFPTWHGPDFTCNFPQTVLRPIETDQSQIYPKPLLCFDSHLLVNISRCSSQHLSLISSKHCLCLQFNRTESNWDSCQTEKIRLYPQSQKCQVTVGYRYVMEPV